MTSLVPVDRLVVGLPEQVERSLRTAYAAGRLLQVTGEPRAYRRGDERVCVDVVLLEPVRPPWWRRPRVVVPVLLAVVAVVAALVWAAVVAVLWIAAHLWLIAAYVALAGLAVLAAARAGVCPGLHCDGCGR